MNFDINKNVAAVMAVCFVGLLMLGCTIFQQGQQNLTPNVTTNVTINQTQNVTTNVSTSNVTVTDQTIVQNVSANISSLMESDFLVMDDSMPNLLTDTPTAPAPQEPQ